jgi:hypothetical protein
MDMVSYSQDSVQTFENNIQKTTITISEGVARQAK